MILNYSNVNGGKIMNNILIENIDYSMNKDKNKNKLFKELIINYLIKQISEES